MPSSAAAATDFLGRAPGGTNECHRAQAAATDFLRFRQERTALDPPVSPRRTPRKLSANCQGARRGGSPRVARHLASSLAGCGRHHFSSPPSASFQLASPRLSRRLGALLRGSFRGDVPRPEAVSRVQEIVRTAQQADVRSVSCAEPCKRPEVIELEKCPSSAAPPLRRNEGTLTTVSRVSFSPYRHAQVTPTFAVRHGASFARRRFGHGRRDRSSARWSCLPGRARRLRLGLRSTRP